MVVCRIHNTCHRVPIDLMFHLYVLVMIQLILTLKMTTAQVVETSVTVNNNHPIQDYVHPRHSYSTNLPSVVFTLFLCWRWDLQLAVCTWYKISSDKINFCLAGKNNLSYIIIVRTVPDRDLEIRERGWSSRPLNNGGGGQSPKNFCRFSGPHDSLVWK